MAKKQTFEEALKNLEEITSDLEEGNLPLELSLKKFNEGMKLAKLCNKQLEEARQEVNILLEENGITRSVPFAEGDNEEL